MNRAADTHHLNAQDPRPRSAADSSAQLVLRYGATLLVVAIAAVIAYPLRQEFFILPFFLIAVVICAWYGDAGAGAVAGIAGAFIIHFFFQFPGLKTWPGIKDGPRLAQFVLIAALITYLIAARKKAERSLREAHDELEAEVAARTADLTQTNRRLRQEAAERRLAQAIALQYEQELREVIEAVPAIVTRTSGDGAAEFLSHGWQEFTGVPVEEGLGWKWIDVIHPDDRTSMLAAWRVALEHGETFETEVRVRRADGQYRWWFLRTVPLRDGRGDIVKWYGTAIDIDARKQAEEQLRRAEEQARRVIDTIPQQIWSGPANGTVDFCNYQWRAYTGLELEEAEGTGWQQALHPDDKERVLKAWNEAVASGAPFEQVVRHRKADGTYRWFISRCLPLRNVEGQVERWYGSNTDIEDRKRAEEALKQSEFYLTESQRLTHTGSWAWNTRSDKYKYWSEEMFRIFGLDLREEPPSLEESRQLVHSEDIGRLILRMENAIREKGRYVEECRLLLPDGTLKYLHVIGHPVLDPTGEVAEYVGTTVDVTERKRAEEAVQAAAHLARSYVEVMMRSLHVLTTTTEPQRLIGEMLRTIGQHLRARCVMLWLLSQGDESLHLHMKIENDQRVSPDPAHPFVRNPSAWKTNALIQEMLSIKAPISCDDIERDSRIGSELRKYLLSKAYKRMLFVPMFVLGEPRGYVSIYHDGGGSCRTEEIQFAQALADEVMLALELTHLVEQERQAAILKERTRMARDIHDTLAQGLIGVIVQMEATEEALLEEDPEQAVQHLRRARELAREGLGEARRSIYALRPQVLEKAAFADALKTMIQNATAGTPLNVAFELAGEPCDLVPDLEDNLLQIGREALTNALKHAHATEFKARLSFEEKIVRLEVCDNGNGFVADSRSGSGIGLIGMRERTEQIGGTLTVDSEPGAGTKISVVAPCLRPHGV